MKTTAARSQVKVLPRTSEGGVNSPLLAAARLTLLVLLMAAPLAFGAVEAWAWSAISLISILILVLWAIHCVRSGRANLVGSWLYVPGVVLLAFALVQLLVRWTLDPIATREAVIKLATYLLLFLLTQHTFAEASPRQWRTAAVAITIYALAVALFAIVQFFASPGVLYGLVKPRWGGYVFGPYVSHNNYAGLMEMLIPIAVAVTLTLRRGHHARLFALFAVLICVLSVLLSGSRGGVISVIVEFGIFAAIIFLGPNAAESRGRTLVIALVLLTIAGGLFLWLDPGDVWKRWELAANSPNIAFLQDRGKMTADALRMSRANLAHGVGMGAFETAYPRYQAIATDFLVDYAHNDYAQFVAEAGLLGWILLPLTIACFLWLSFRRLRARLTQPTRWLQLGAALGVCGILVHSFVDFNLHIPANAAWFATCAALALLSHERIGTSTTLRALCPIPLISREVPAREGGRVEGHMSSAHLVESFLTISATGQVLRRQKIL